MLPRLFVVIGNNNFHQQFGWEKLNTTNLKSSKVTFPHEEPDFSIGGVQSTFQRRVNNIQLSKYLLYDIWLYDFLYTRLCWVYEHAKVTCSVFQLPFLFVDISWIGPGIQFPFMNMHDSFLLDESYDWLFFHDSEISKDWLPSYRRVSLFCVLITRWGAHTLSAFPDVRKSPLIAAIPLLSQESVLALSYAWPFLTSSSPDYCSQLHSVGFWSWNCCLNMCRSHFLFLP